MKLNTNPEMTSSYIKTEKVVTKFGKFLRATSIDETTQLFNILVGHMAFIGPRPLIDVHEDHITIEMRRENGAITLRPGISGYAQIHGRTAVSPEQKGYMDGVYYQRFSLWYDTKIFVYTFLKLFGAAKGR
jgi:O-antigen biosynthesis protein WbqP